GIDPSLQIGRHGSRSVPQVREPTGRANNVQESALWHGGCLPARQMDSDFENRRRVQEMLMATLTAHPRKASPLRSRSPGTLQGGAIIGSLHIDRDGDLVAGLRGRDGEAAEILVARYGERLYRLAIRITGSEADAEAVVKGAAGTAACEVETVRGA